MPDFEKEKAKQQQVNGNELNNANINLNDSGNGYQNVSGQPGQPGTEAQAGGKNKASEELTDQAYYEKLLSSMEGDNLALKELQDITVKEGDWASYSHVKKVVFEKVPPVAKKDRFFGSSEDSDVSRCRKTFGNADLCTAREYAALTEYFRTRNPEVEALENGKNEAFDPVLLSYVDAVLSVEIKVSSFTDDYLSKNMPVLYEYSRNIGQYKELYAKYPVFFDSLPEEKTIELESRAKLGEALDDFIATHLYLHGIEIQDGVDGNELPVLRKESEEKQKRLADRERDKRIYEETLDRFIGKAFRREQFRLSGVFTATEAFRSETVLAEMESRAASDPEATELLGPQMQTALNEMGRILKIRDKLLSKLADLRGKRTAAASQEEKEKLDGRIGRANNRILFLTRCADHYRDFIDFALGDKERVSAETAKFLTAQGNTDLMEIVTFKDMAACIEETFTASDRIRAAKELNTLSKQQNPDPKKKEELERKLNTGLVYSKMTKKAFYDKLRYFAASKKEMDTMEGYRAGVRQAREDNELKAAALAEKYSLKNHASRVYVDVSNVDGCVQDYEWFCLAMCYSPTDATPMEVRQQIVEKGIRPFLNKFLSLKAEDMEELRLTGKPDMKNKAFWEHSNLVRIGFIMPEFIGALKAQNVNLTDEETAHLLAIGVICQQLAAPYRNIAETTYDSLECLLMEGRAKEEGARLFVDYFSCFTNDSKPPKEVEKVFKKYGKKKLGYGLTDANGLKISLPEMISRYLVKNYVESSSDTAPDYQNVYSQKFAQVIGEQKKEKKEKEKEILQEQKELRQEEEEKQEEKEVQQEEEQKQEKGRLSFEKRFETEKIPLQLKEVSAKHRNPEREKGGTSACSADYASFTEALNAVGGNSIHDSRDMRFIKEKLAALKGWLNEPLGKNQKTDFYLMRTGLLSDLNEAEDACRNFMLRKETEGRTEQSERYRNVRALLRELPKLRIYYSSLSEERVLAAGNGVRTFGEVMSRDETMNTESTLIKREAEKQVRKHDWIRQKKLLDSLVKKDYSKPGFVDPGGAGDLYWTARDLNNRLNKKIPVSEEKFAKAKEEILDACNRALNACRTYSTGRTPKLPGGKKRLDTVRRLMGIYERQLAYLTSADSSVLYREGKRKGTWGNIFNSDASVVNKAELPKLEYDFSPENAAVPYEANLLSQMLGAGSIYQKTQAVVSSDEKGKHETGFLCQKFKEEPDPDTKGLKTIRDAISFARKQKMDIAYSNKALEQLSALKLMDFLTGRKNRTQDDLLYYTTVEDVEGQEMVNIAYVVSRNESRSFTQDSPMDPVEYGLVDKNGEFLIPYDRDFADRVMNADPDRLLQDLIDKGARLDENTQKAFAVRFQVLQNLFRNDEKMGWRYMADNEDYNSLRSASRNKSYSLRETYAEAEKLPEFVNGELVRNRRKKALPPDLSKLPKPEENVWLDEKGERKKQVEYHDLQLDQAKLDEIEKIADPRERKEAREKAEYELNLLNAKRKIKILEDYKKLGSRSAEKMKKKKADLLQRVTAKLQALPEEASAEYRSILEDLQDYASNVITAQYEKRDRELKRQEEAEGETAKEKELRVFMPERTIREKTVLRDVRKKIEERLQNINQLLKDGGELSPVLQEEKASLEAYQKEFHDLWRGTLKKPPKGTYRKVFEQPGMIYYDVEYEKEDTGFMIPKYDGLKQMMTDFIPAELRTEEKKVPLEFRNEKDTPLFSHEPCAEDVCQGFLGDCYVLAATAQLAERDPEAIKSMMHDNGETVTVKLYDVTEEPPKPYLVTVTKEVPVKKGDPKHLDYFAGNCLWVQMIEKAFVVSGLVEKTRTAWDPNEHPENQTDQEYAYYRLKRKDERAYQSIKGGKSGMFLMMLTGSEKTQYEFVKNMSSSELKETKKLRDPKSGRLPENVLEQKKKDVIAALRRELEEKKNVVLVDSRQDLEAVDGLGQSSGESILRGFAGKHAYTLMDIVKIGDEDYLAVRNPWGEVTATHEVNELTGGISVNMNRFDSASYLITVEEYLTFFGDYQTMKLDLPKRKEKNKK